MGEAEREWDRKAIDSIKFEKLIRKYSDEEYDSFTFDDIKDSFDYLSQVDKEQLVNAFREGDESEFGRLAFKAGFIYADVLGALRADKHGC